MKKMKRAEAEQFVHDDNDWSVLDLGKVPEDKLSDVLTALEGVFLHESKIAIESSEDLDDEAGKDIASFLESILKSSKKVSHLRLSLLPLSLDDFEKVAHSMSKNFTLKNLEIEDLEIGDEGLEALLDVVRPDQFETVVVKNCGVTNAIGDAVIRYATGKNSEVVSFEIKDRKFTRGRELAAKIEECCEMQDTIIGTEENTSVADIQAENEKLRRRISSLRNMTNPMVAHDSTFVVGPRAAEFAKKLNDLCREIEQLEV